jgi:hypothetical protein
MTRWICTDCRFIGLREEFDIVRDPKVVGNTWTICPKCRSADHITDACDEPGCDREASCGFPVDDERGYRRTCYEHSVFKQEADARREVDTP